MGAQLRKFALIGHHMAPHLQELEYQELGSRAGGSGAVPPAPAGVVLGLHLHQQYQCDPASALPCPAACEPAHSRQATRSNGL